MSQVLEYNYVFVLGFERKNTSCSGIVLLYPHRHLVSKEYKVLCSILVTDKHSKYTSVLHPLTCNCSKMPTTTYFKSSFFFFPAVVLLSI